MRVTRRAAALGALDENVAVVETGASRKRGTVGTHPAVAVLRSDVDARLAYLAHATHTALLALRSELAAQLATLSPELRAMPLHAFRDTFHGALSADVLEAVSSCCISSGGASSGPLQCLSRASLASMPPPPPSFRAALPPVAPTPGLVGPTAVKSTRTLRRTPPSADELAGGGAGAVACAAPPGSAAAGTVVAGTRKRARVPPPPVPLFAAAAAPPALAVLATPAFKHPRLQDVNRLPPGATPATQRRMRCVLGAAGCAPTPGGPATRVPQAGEVFFSANGSPLGAFVDDGQVPSTPMGPVQANPGAEEVPPGEGDLESVLEGLPDAKLAGLQSFIHRLMGRKA